MARPFSYSLLSACSDQFFKLGGNGHFSVAESGSLNFSVNHPDSALRKMLGKDSWAGNLLKIGSTSVDSIDPV